MLHIIGLLWCSQPNGDMFTYSTHLDQVKSLDRPHIKDRVVCLSACVEAVWVLTENGKVYIRNGIGSYSPQGAGWVELDLLQLGRF